MKAFGDLSLSEGSDIHNLTVANGTTFPSTGNVGELFYFNGVGGDAGLYVHDGSSWNLAVLNDTKFRGRVADSVNARYAIYGGSSNQTVSSSPLTVQWPITVFDDAMSAPIAGTFDRIIVNEAGLYEISYSLTITGGGSSCFEAYLAVNGSQIFRTSSFCVTSSNSGDRYTMTARHIVSLNTGNDVRVLVRRVRGSGSTTVTATDRQLILQRIK